MDDYIENPLVNASYETVYQLTQELNIGYTEDLVALYKELLTTAKPGLPGMAATLAKKQAERHPCFTLAEMHTHLKVLIDHGFRLTGLTDDEKEHFLTWSEQFEMMPGNATPFEIYYAADRQVLTVLTLWNTFQEHLMTNINMMREIDRDGTGYEFTVYKRIAHILRALLGLPMPRILLEGLNRLLYNMSYQPPWDEEGAIYDSLKVLGQLCQTHFPDGQPRLHAAFTADLSGSTLQDELSCLSALGTLAW